MATRNHKKWKQIFIKKDGIVLTGYLHPVGSVGNGKYWSFTCSKGGVHRKSLKVTHLKEATEIALNWFDGKGHRDRVEQEDRDKAVASIMTWDDWKKIQVAHADKRAVKKRAARTLEECLKSQRLFIAVTKAENASAVDADMVERFQRECLKRLTKYGKPYEKPTILKTLSHMSASFNRCNRNAGRKCVGGVVPRDNLLTENPFEQIKWIELEEQSKRQFSNTELKAFLSWRQVASCPLISIFAKVSLWACGRLEELTELQWSWVDENGYVTIPDEIAKWGKGRMIKVPQGLLQEMQTNRTSSPYVWAGYPDQLRRYYMASGSRASVHKIRDFTPQRLRRVVQNWINAWAKEAKVPGLSHHAFRRTGLQMSREGRVRILDSEYAKAAHVSLHVANNSYTVRPDKLFADLAYRNIEESLSADPELACIMGLEHNRKAEAPSIDDVLAALSRDDSEEATRLLQMLRS